jgi:hypothetical protein
MQTARRSPSTTRYWWLSAVRRRPDAVQASPATARQSSHTDHHDPVSVSEPVSQVREDRPDDAHSTSSTETVHRPAQRRMHEIATADPLRPARYLDTRELQYANSRQRMNGNQSFGALHLITTRCVARYERRVAMMRL